MCDRSPTQSLTRAPPLLSPPHPSSSFKKSQAVRNETKLGEVFGSQLLEAPTPPQPGHGLLDCVAGVDVTDAGTLVGKPELFAETDHVSSGYGRGGKLDCGGVGGLLLVLWACVRACVRACARVRALVLDA